MCGRDVHSEFRESATHHDGRPDEEQEGLYFQRGIEKLKAIGPHGTSLPLYQSEEEGVVCEGRDPSAAKGLLNVILIKFVADIV